MFDSLLGRGFTTKCKHAIKCIFERLKPIRNRRQAVINILRKDIADLIQSCNAEHAFSRMDELIIEMNRLACYDMIEKFCGSVLIHLRLLQKQRECPPEDSEAISTLIFAAARFPDLPELCDLRQAFTVRYQGAMEASVNQAFKDKSASKAFSVGKKIYLMKNITSEYNVKWDSESFEYKITNPIAYKHNQMKERDALKAPKAFPLYEKDGMFKPVVTKVKDIHVISHEPVPVNKSNRQTADSENGVPSSMDASHSHAKPEKDKHGNLTENWHRKTDTHIMSLSAREIFDPINQDGKMEERKCNNAYAGRGKVSSDTFKQKDANTFYQDDDDTIYKSKRSLSRAKAKLNPDDEKQDSMENLKLKDESKSVRTPSIVQKESDCIGDYKSKNKAPFVARRGGGDDDDDAIVFKRCSRAQMTPNIDDEGGVEEKLKSKHAGRVIHAAHGNGIAAKESYDAGYRTSRATIDFQAGHKQAAGQQESEKIDITERVSQHMKPKDKNVKNDVVHSEGLEKNGAIHERSGRTGRRADLGSREERMACPEKPSDVRAFHMLPPPYVKSVVSIVGAETDHVKPSRLPTRDDLLPTSVKSKNECMELRKDETVAADDDRFGSRSLRRKQHKPPVTGQGDINFYGDEPSVPIRRGHRRRSSRQNIIPPPAGIHDEEETVVDDLLMHYSRKGLPDHASKHRRRPRTPPADRTVLDAEAGQHRPHKLDAMSFHDRTMSLPPDAFTPGEEERVRVPARATSLHRDSPISARTHPLLPDYDELAARFAALKRG